MRAMLVSSALACVLFYVMSDFYGQLLSHNLKSSHQSSSESLAKQIDQDLGSMHSQLEQLIHLVLSSKKEERELTLQKKVESERDIVAFTAYQADENSKFTIRHQMVHPLASLEYDIDKKKWGQLQFSEKLFTEGKTVLSHYLPDQPIDLFTLTFQQNYQFEDRPNEHWRFRIDFRKGALTHHFNSQSSFNSFIVDSYGRLFVHGTNSLNSPSPTGKDMSFHPLVDMYLKNQSHPVLTNFQAANSNAKWGLFHPMKSASLALITESSKELIEEASKKVQYRTLLASTFTVSLLLFLTFFMGGSSPAISLAAGRIPGLPQSTGSPIAATETGVWFLVRLTSSAAEGPYTLSQLSAMLDSGNIQFDNSYVYRPGDLQMTPVAQIQGFDRRSSTPSRKIEEEAPPEEVTATANNDDMFIKGSNGELLGPLSIEDLKQQLSNGNIARNCPIWKKNTNSWVFLYDLPEFDQRAGNRST